MKNNKIKIIEYLNQKSVIKVKVTTKIIFSTNWNREEKKKCIVLFTKEPGY